MLHRRAKPVRTKRTRSLLRLLWIFVYAFAYQQLAVGFSDNVNTNDTSDALEVTQLLFGDVTVVLDFSFIVNPLSLENVE